MDTLGYVCMVSAGMLTISWNCGTPPLPCPKFNWKDLAAFVGAALGAFVYLAIMGLKRPLTSIDVIACNVIGIALGRFIIKVLCPIPIK